MEPSFLIVRFSAIGDCVMTAYVATAIRSAFPKAALTWAVETRCMAMLEKGRLLNNVVDFPRDQWRKTRWSPRVWQEQLGRFAQLRKFSFDYGMDLQGHSKTAICLKLANPKNRVSAFATDTLAQRLNPLTPGDPDAKHRVERMLETAQTFGDFTMPERPIMPAPIGREALGFSEMPLVTISTGAGAVNKQYPDLQWAAVAQGLVARGMNVAFLGADSDPKIAVPGVVDMIGKFTLGQTMSAVAHSAIHLAADTGTGHMAAAFGVPFVSVFGPTDPNLFRPYSDRGVVLRESLSPADVPPSRILDAAEALLG